MYNQINTRNAYKIWIITSFIYFKPILGTYQCFHCIHCHSVSIAIDYTKSGAKCRFGCHVDAGISKISCVTLPRIEYFPILLFHTENIKFHCLISLKITLFHIDIKIHLCRLILNSLNKLCKLTFSLVINPFHFL